MATKTRNTWPDEVRPAPRWQFGVSLVLAILLGRSHLADGGDKPVRRDSSGSVGQVASSAQPYA